MDSSSHDFIQGVFQLRGRAASTMPARAGRRLAYKVPPDKRAQIIYLRAGNSADELIYLILLRDGKPMRYFPIGAKQSDPRAAGGDRGHLPREPARVLVAAPEGRSRAIVVIDIGLAGGLRRAGRRP